jgi:hypothetical protein
MDSWHNASCIHLADVGESRARRAHIVFALVIQGSATVEPDTFVLFHNLVWLIAWQRLSV